MIRSRTLVGVTLAALTLTGCTGGQRASGGQPAQPALLDGAAILERTCTQCHTLRGLSAYANYWGEPEWRSMVDTMIGYGAELGPEELPVLVRYLAVNYGTAGRDSVSPGRGRP
jgi:mono/diheme cytochrome c family protein